MSALSLLLSLATAVHSTQDTPPASFPWDACDPDSTVLMGVHSAVFDQQYRLSFGGQTISRTRAERADSTSTWNEDDEEYTVSFFITAWCGREGGDDIYVCGVKPSGQSV